MSDSTVMAKRHWESALRAAHAVVREPGALAARERELLRDAVVTQLEAAVAVLDTGTATPAELGDWHAFLPGAIDALAGTGGLDAGLVSARDHVRRGLDALAAA